MGVMQFNTSEEEAITEAINQELNNKRVDKVTEEIVGILLEEFAKGKAYEMLRCVQYPEKVSEQQPAEPRVHVGPVLPPSAAAQPHPRHRD